MTYWRVSIPAISGAVFFPGREHWAKDDGVSLTLMDKHGKAEPAIPIVGNALTTLQNRFGNTAPIGKANLDVGEYHPRIWRGQFSPRPSQTHQLAWTMSVQAARNLFLDMREVFRCIEPSSANLLGYGHRIRELIILACTEVESAWKSVLEANGYVRTRGGHWTTEDYVKLLAPLQLSQWQLSLVMHTEFPSFKPFDGWDSVAPTRSLKWYADYNAIKHGREADFRKATLESLVHAMGAVFVMVSAQFGPRLPFVDNQHGASSSMQSNYPWTEDMASLSSLWADDFALLAEPVWPLESQYVPPVCAAGATWKQTALTF